MTPEQPGPPAATRPFTRRRTARLHDDLSAFAWRFGWSARMAGLGRDEAHDDLNLVDLARYADTLTRYGRSQVLAAWREGWDAQREQARKQAALEQAIREGRPIPPPDTRSRGTPE